ncbi:hypothetical protein DWB77_00294 [Streptomyces hundungensis]|uniref:Uncharacterized protein n=1 Tax=Streptomyces hundungensis TaxID=1077946 RepID=A0A387HBP2_9ACTN|nr:hypothetical protein [Streptomyces hundungensis]AYG78187.1 hypothetical protein DWB77_00294 [Streptomyces hundungensis]
MIRLLSRSRPPSPARKGKQPAFLKRISLIVAGAVTAGLMSTLPAAADPAGPPVPLASVAATGDDQVFALAADHSAVYQWSGHGTDWVKVGGPAQDLYAGGAGLFATNPDTHKIHKYNGTPDQWTEIGNPGAEFAVTSDHLYGLNPERTAVYEWNGHGTDWTKVGGPAQDLYAGGAGLFATNPDTHKIHKYNGTPDQWTEIGNPGAEFAVTSDHLYGLNPERTAVYEWNGHGTDWTKVGGPAQDLYAGGAGLFATNPDTKDLHKYDDAPEVWSQAGGPGADFTVSNQHVYGLSPERTAVFQRTGDGTNWTALGAPLASAPAADPGPAATSPAEAAPGSTEKPAHDGDTAPAQAPAVQNTGQPNTGPLLSVTAKDDLYAVAPDHNSVWKRDGDHWTRIGDAAQSVHAGAGGVFTLSAEGKVYRYAKPDRWTEIADRTIDLEVSGQHVYRLSADRSYVYEWSAEAPSGWVQLGGQNGQPLGWYVKEIYAGAAGLFAANANDGSISWFDEANSQWRRVGGPGAAYAVSDKLYGLTPNRSQVLQWTREGEKWTVVGGPAQDIFAGGAGLFATRPGTGDVYRYQGTPDQWLQVGGPGKAFAVSGKHLYALSSDRPTISRWSAEQCLWTSLGLPEDSSYERARQTGFTAPVPTGATRVRISGSPGNDNGIIMARFFIPTKEAAMGILHGDDRPFSNDPGEPGYRMALFWDTATGAATFTVLPSTRTTAGRVAGILDGNFRAEIPARPIVMGSFGNVAKMQRSAGWLNTIESLRLDGTELHVKIHGVNSALPVFAVDTDFTVRLGPDGLATVTRAGDAYPNLEVLQYRPGQSPRVLARDEMASRELWRNGLNAIPTFPDINRSWVNGIRTTG